MDLILCVDTSVAHLAGALGKPVWVMLPRHADFRWLIEREDSPWYPTVRLFRQLRSGDWIDVVGRVRGALEKWAVRMQQPTLRASGPTTAVGLPRSLPLIDSAGLDLGHRSGLAAVMQTRTGILQYLPDEPIVGDSIAWYGEYLQPQLDLLGKVVRRGATVMEIGAGVGEHAVALCRMIGETGRAFLWESRPVAAQILRQNLAANGIDNATLMPSARGAALRFEEDIAPANALGALRLERLDCLKVRAGIGALEVLEAASDTLWRLRPLLFLAADDETSLSRLAGQTRELGYRCWRTETTLFNARNYDLRDEDIFGGRTELALLAIPEEASMDVDLDECTEIS
jgi:precorrin-6B methylase 2